MVEIDLVHGSASDRGINLLIVFLPVMFTPFAGKRADVVRTRVLTATPQNSMSTALVLCHAGTLALDRNISHKFVSMIILHITSAWKPVKTAMEQQRSLRQHRQYLLLLLSSLRHLQQLRPQSLRHLQSFQLLQ